VGVWKRGAGPRWREGQCAAGERRDASGRDRDPEWAGRRVDGGDAAVRRRTTASVPEVQRGLGCPGGDMSALQEVSPWRPRHTSFPSRGLRPGLQRYAIPSAPIVVQIQSGWRDRQRRDERQSLPPSRCRDDRGPGETRSCCISVDRPYVDRRELHYTTALYSQCQVEMR
jgi:hypothetical protein